MRIADVSRNGDDCGDTVEAGDDEESARKVWTRWEWVDDRPVSAREYFSQQTKN